MFNPRYRIVMTKKCFPQDNFICLGTQLTSLVCFFQEVLPAHTWYGADVEAVGIGANELNIRDIQPKLIGSDQRLIQYCSKIDQFIWGEFLCIDNNYSSQAILNIELETEDLPFRSLPMPGVFIEIRMFDTSYIEIYSENEITVTKTLNKFQNSELLPERQNLKGYT